MSSWMTAAARRTLLLRDGLAAVTEWEQDNGSLSEEEMRAARGRVARELQSSRARRPA